MEPTEQCCSEKEQINLGNKSSLFLSFLGQQSCPYYSQAQLHWRLLLEEDGIIKSQEI
jgi:hypothetical protein